MSLIPFIYFVSGRCISKRAKMSVLPKCVPNKWYSSQNGISLEIVLAKGVKSMGLVPAIPAARAQEHTVGGGRGPAASVDLAAQKRPLTVSQQAPQGNLTGPLGPLSDGRWKPSREKNHNDAWKGAGGEKKEVRWGSRELHQIHITNRKGSRTVILLLKACCVCKNKVHRSLLGRRVKKNIFDRITNSLIIWSLHFSVVDR